MSIKARASFFFQDLKRIWSIIWKTDKKLAIVNALLQVVQSLLPVISLYYIKVMIEAVFAGGGDFSAVLNPIIIFSCIQILIAIMAQYSAYITKIYQQKITDHLSQEVLQKAIEVDYDYYENPSYHDTLHLAQQQSMYKASQLLSSFNAILLNSTSLFFLTGLFLSLNSSFALLFIAMSLPLAIIKWYQGQSLARQERKLAPAEREANYIHNMLTNTASAKEVRVLWFGHSYIQKFRSIRAAIFTEKKQLNLKHANYSFIAESVEIVAMSALFIVMARSAWEKSMTIGTFVIYIQGFQRLQSTSRSFLQSIVQVLQQNIFLKDLFTFLDIRTDNKATETASFPVPRTGLSVQQLSFTYPQANRPALQNVSIQCKPGSIIAIVGENGSGKSTLVKLLARLYNIQSGKVQIDDVNINSITMRDFRANSNFMFQDFEKYFLSVEENIKLGDDVVEADHTDVVQAATLSGAHPFISKLSKGYQTRLGRYFESSEQLSGGQWQKLVLSRIFYRNAQLIVMDEPTSALDAIAEAELFNNIKSVLNDKMVVLISHRLYNLKFADTIYVMHEGKIVQQGSFDELVNSSGKFNEMYQAQKL